MTTTLQEALLKAGLVSKEKLKKAENEKKQAEHAERQQAQQAARQSVHQGTKKGPGRPGSPNRPGSTNRPGKNVPPPRRETPPVKKSLGFIEGKHHHHMRTDCESCKKSSPDVEYYQHKDKRIDTYWFCVRCADDHSIPDATRMTMQSQHAQSGLFRRNYGATKIFK